MALRLIQGGLAAADLGEPSSRSSGELRVRPHRPPPPAEPISHLPLLTFGVITVASVTLLGFLF